MADIHNAGFVWMQCDPEFFQDALGGSQKHFSLRVAVARGYPVIGISGDFVAATPHFPIKWSQ